MTDPAGWLEPEIAKAMWSLIRRTRPDVCVEIGVFGGKSLVNTAQGLKDNGKGIVYGIDSWRKEDVLSALPPNESREWWDKVDLDAVHYDCMRALWERELEQYAVVIRARSDVAYRLFEVRSVDILYVDGGHSEEVAFRDVCDYLPKVKEEGWILLDDTDYASLEKALGMVEEQCHLSKDFGRARLYRKN